MFRNSLNENLMHLKFLSQEELQIVPSPLCPRQICEMWKQKINTEMTTYLLSPAIPATGLSTGGAMTEPSCLPLFTGVEVCNFKSSAKQYTTYYTFISMKKKLIPVDCVYKFSGLIHCSHEKKVPELGFQIDLMHLTCWWLLYCT